MARKFRELEEEMTPESRARARQKAEEYVTEMLLGQSRPLDESLMREIGELVKDVKVSPEENLEEGEPL